MRSLKSYVAYYRVSTQRQGNSGLGLEAQQAAVAAFVGSHGTVVSEYVEIESGKKDSRPKMDAAIAEAKNIGARLVIAKLDRLSRNASFIFQLRDSGVDFVAADMPDANTLTVGIFAVIAQHERETISKRTKDALAAKKARGESLGKPENLSDKHRALGREIHMLNARTAKSNVQATGIIQDKRQLKWTYQQIADHLNQHHFTTRRGCQWTPGAVQRLVVRSLKPVCRLLVRNDDFLASRAS